MLAAMKRSSWLPALPLLALAAGCASPVGPVPPGIEPKEYGAMQYWASQTTSCPREQLTYESIAPGRHLFKGCNQEVEMMQLTQGLFGGGMYIQSATTRFSKETKCEIKATKIDKVDDVTYVVEGCDKRITYVRDCTGSVTCSWVANMASEKK
jgi:hypothetical protein